MQTGNLDFKASDPLRQQFDTLVKAVHAGTDVPKMFRDGVFVQYARIKPATGQNAKAAPVRRRFCQTIIQRGRTVTRFTISPCALRTP